MVATTYLLRDLLGAKSKREVRLFEGFVSFKPRMTLSDHVGDVLQLREVVWTPRAHAQAIWGPDRLARDQSDTVCSAFRVAGMDFGVPPVIIASASCS